MYTYLHTHSNLGSNLVFPIPLHVQWKPIQTVTQVQKSAMDPGAVMRQFCIRQYEYCFFPMVLNVSWLSFGKQLYHDYMSCYGYAHITTSKPFTYFKVIPEYKAKLKKFKL